MSHDPRFDNFAMQHIRDQEDIYPVFRELFQKQLNESREYFHQQPAWSDWLFIPVAFHRPLTQTAQVTPPDVAHQRMIVGEIAATLLSVPKRRAKINWPAALDRQLTAFRHGLIAPKMTLLDGSLEFNFILYY